MKKFLIKLVGDFTYIIVPLLLLAVIIPIDIVYGLFAKFDASVIAGISGSLIGFLITSLSIILAMPKSEKVLKKIQRGKIDVYLMRCFIFGILFYSFSLLFSLLANSFVYSISIALYFFVGAVVNTAIIVFALIKFGKSVF